MSHVREPAVSGLFYPDEPAVLSRMIDGFLADRGLNAPAQAPAPKAVIVPHAGYVYSGALASAALKAFAPDKHMIRRIVMLGPCHRVAVRGLAAPAADIFETPLGPIQIDRAAIDSVTALPQVTIDDRPHRDEHCLEVQLPILLRVLEHFTLVPFAVGQSVTEEVAQVLRALWGGEETRIVISSDLSHYLDQNAARRLDDATALAIERLDWKAIGTEQACGRIPIAGLLEEAQARSMAVERIGLCTSADTAGSPSRVVGYGAWAFR